MDSTGQERSPDKPGTASAHTEPVISVRGLVKRYGSHEAVAGRRDPRGRPARTWTPSCFRDCTS